MRSDRVVRGRLLYKVCPTVRNMKVPLATREVSHAPARSLGRGDFFIKSERHPHLRGSGGGRGISYLWLIDFSKLDMCLILSCGIGKPLYKVGTTPLDIDKLADIDKVKK
jgi:hypothetical protein